MPDSTSVVVPDQPLTELPTHLDHSLVKSLPDQKAHGMATPEHKRGQEGEHGSDAERTDEGIRPLAISESHVCDPPVPIAVTSPDISVSETVWDDGERSVQGTAGPRNVLAVVTSADSSMVYSADSSIYDGNESIDTAAKSSPIESADAPPTLPPSLQPLTEPTFVFKPDNTDQITTSSPTSPHSDPKSDIDPMQPIHVSPHSVPPSKPDHQNTTSHSNQRASADNWHVGRTTANDDAAVESLKSFPKQEATHAVDLAPKADSVRAKPDGVKASQATDPAEGKPAAEQHSPPPNEDGPVSRILPTRHDGGNLPDPLFVNDTDVGTGVSRIQTNDSLVLTPGSTQLNPVAGHEAKSANVGAEGDATVEHGDSASQASKTLAEAHASGATTASAMSAISSAKLLERLGESELRLGLRAGEFGTVDIRTSMSRNHFSAEISVERSELGQVLAADMPALHDRLSERRIPIANIVLQNQAGGNTSPEQQKPREGQLAPSNSYDGHAREGVAPAAAASHLISAETATRLDVHM